MFCCSEPPFRIPLLGTVNTLAPRDMHPCCHAFTHTLHSRMKMQEACVGPRGLRVESRFASSQPVNTSPLGSVVDRLRNPRYHLAARVPVHRPQRMSQRHRGSDDQIIRDIPISGKAAYWLQ